MTRVKNSVSAVRCGLEFISGPITGVFVGHGVDRLFNSHPWALIVFIVLGIAAGFLNLYRFVIKDRTLLKKPED